MDHIPRGRHCDERVGSGYLERLVTQIPGGAEVEKSVQPVSVMGHFESGGIHAEAILFSSFLGGDLEVEGRSAGEATTGY